MAEGIDRGLELYSSLSAVVDRLAADDFWTPLCRWLASVFAYDQIAVFHYVDDRAPRRLFDLNPSGERDHLHHDLLKAAYWIGPYYNNVVRNRASDGFYSIGAIAPDAFHATEYYRIYYRQKHAADEGMYFADLHRGHCVGLLAERSEPSARFTSGELREQQAMGKLVASLVRKHFSLLDAPSADQSPVGQQMRTALARFGREVLSERERQVAELILRGHSSKSGARVLGISPETERVHRKRLYHKLRVSSQSELFWVFVQSVQLFDPKRYNDPLQAWFDRE